MPPQLLTIGDQIAWSYANLARAHAALSEGATSYARHHHAIRAKLFKRLCSGEMAMRSLYDDERRKALGPRACAYCGDTDTLSIDHLIPRIRGGSDDGVNLVLACRCCNSGKGGLDLLEWYARHGSFPPLLLLRRYLKLVAARCASDGLLDIEMTAAAALALPFPIAALPCDFPPLASLRL